jgi:hypothetical protein
MFIMLFTAGRADPIADEAPSAHGCCGAFVSDLMSADRDKALQTRRAAGEGAGNPLRMSAPPPHASGVMRFTNSAWACRRAKFCAACADTVRACVSHARLT